MLQMGKPCVLQCHVHQRLKAACLNSAFCGMRWRVGSKIVTVMLQQDK